MRRFWTSLALIVSFFGCRRRVTAADGGLRRAVDVADAAAVAPEAAAGGAGLAPRAWCWRALPRVDLRAIDPQGGLWTLAGRRLTEASSGRTEVLAEEIPCILPGAWAMEFGRDGSAFLLADSRFHVRGGAGAGFAVTPLCTDLGGSPFARRAAGAGWSFVSHRSRAVEPTLMPSRSAGGGTGWYAVTGMDDATRAVVLGPDESLVTLAGGDRLIFVDRVNTVAGEVIAAQGERFDGITRSAAGVTAHRDDEGRRVVVYTEAAAGPYTRAAGPRPAGPRARTVVRVDLARFLAVSERTVELSDDRGATWRRVFDAGAGVTLERPQVGWLVGHHLAVATRDGVVTDDCAGAGAQ